MMSKRSLMMRLRVMKKRAEMKVTLKTTILRLTVMMRRLEVRKRRKVMEAVKMTTRKMKALQCNPPYLLMCLEGH